MVRRSRWISRHLRLYEYYLIPSISDAKSGSEVKTADEADIVD